MRKKRLRLAAMVLAFGILATSVDWSFLRISAEESNVSIEESVMGEESEATEEESTETILVEESESAEESHAFEEPVLSEETTVPERSAITKISDSAEEPSVPIDELTAQAESEPVSESMYEMYYNDGAICVLQRGNVPDESYGVFDCCYKMVEGNPPLYDDKTRLTTFIVKDPYQMGPGKRLSFF